MKAPYKPELVREKQPFGHVENYDIHRSSMADYPIESKSLDGMFENGVNALNHPPKTKDESLQAMNRASMHHDHPFYWTGHPKDKV
jgi:hypothetical protein